MTEHTHSARVQLEHLAARFRILYRRLTTTTPAGYACPPGPCEHDI